MKRIIVASVVFLALTSTTVWAGSGQTPAVPDPKIGTHITITGCLHKGTISGSYVLLGITERPAGSSAAIKLAPYAIYWLDSNDGLKPLVGEMVDITGTVKERRPKDGAITVSVDPDETKSTAVQVASNSGSLDVTTKDYNDGPKPKGASNATSSIEVRRPVYKLDVQSVKAVGVPVDGPACR